MKNGSELVQTVLSKGRAVLARIKRILTDAYLWLKQGVCPKPKEQQQQKEKSQQAEAKSNSSQTPKKQKLKKSKMELRGKNETKAEFLARTGQTKTKDTKNIKVTSEVVKGKPKAKKEK